MLSLFNTEEIPARKMMPLKEKKVQQTAPLREKKIIRKEKKKSLRANDGNKNKLTAMWFPIGWNNKNRHRYWSMNISIILACELSLRGKFACEGLLHPFFFQRRVVCVAFSNSDFHTMVIKNLNLWTKQTSGFGSCTEPKCRFTHQCMWSILHLLI